MEVRSALPSRNKLELAIIAHDAPVGLEYSVHDNQVVILIGSSAAHNRGFSFVLPDTSAFSISVVYNKDTARLDVSTDSGLHIAYRDKIDGVTLVNALSIPDLAVCLQCTRDRLMVRKIVQSLRDQCGEEVREILLPVGHYSCLEYPEVRVSSLSRKTAINRTEGGYLLCIEADSPESYRVLIDWASRASELHGLSVTGRAIPGPQRSRSETTHERP